MKPDSKQFLIENYRRLYREHGSGPEVAQLSAEGQRFRFAKLLEVGDLQGSTILDLGCGIGDFLAFLTAHRAGFSYTGIDIVPELIEHARKRYPGSHFECRDILASPPDARFDYVFISGIFNNEIPDSRDFLREMTAAAFGACNKALAFNFISTHVNSVDAGMAYFDPAEVLNHCIASLSPRVALHHHYERCDVAVFVYR